MTIVEMAVLLVAVAFAVLVSYLVPVLIQLRKTVAESEQLFVTMNKDLPPLIGELLAISHNLNDLIEQARGGAEHAAVLLHAVGEVGESIQDAHDVVALLFPEPAHREDARGRVRVAKRRQMHHVEVQRGVFLGESFQRSQQLAPPGRLDARPEAQQLRRLRLIDRGEGRQVVIRDGVRFVGDRVDHLVEGRRGLGGRVAIQFPVIVESAGAGVRGDVVGHVDSVPA